MFEWEISFDLWQADGECFYNTKFWCHCETPTAAVNEVLDQYKDGLLSVCRIDNIKKLREVK